MKLKQFIEKYNKKLLIILFIIFMFKSFQSCNRKMEVNSTKTEMNELKDSLSNVIENNVDTIKVLKVKLDLANAYREAADIRADAVQSVAEKITKNTTVNVEK